MELTERTTRRKALEIGARAGALGMALLVTLKSTAGVGAERPPAGGDTHQIGCRMIYDRSAQLRDEYKRVALANPGDPRLDQILAELRNLGSDWIAIRCKDRFGSIAAIQLPNGQWGDLDDATDLEEWVPISEEPSGGTTPPGTDEHGSSDTSSHRKRKSKKGKRGKRGRR